MDADTLLTKVPEAGFADDVRQWVNDGLSLLAAASFDMEDPRNTVSLALTAADIVDPMLGAYGSERWRRFATAVFLADWACYPRSADRADFGRLLYVRPAFRRAFASGWAGYPMGAGCPSAIRGGIR